MRSFRSRIGAAELIVESRTAVLLVARHFDPRLIFGRNSFYTSIATPNVVQTGDPLFVRYQDQSGSSLLSMGGGPRRGNAYLLEGVSLTDFSNRAAWVPSAESLADMRVQVKTYDAEMGRAAGGAFNVTAKSGSDDMHGSALFLNKPGWGMGNLFFAKRAGLPIPPQYYYNWAGSIGGPIARNKTFFWFSTDDYVQQSTRNIAPQFPTALERTGDFSQTFNASGQQVVIYDPFTTRTVNGQVVRDPFPGNRIPADRISPIALKYLQGVPVPSDGRGLQTSSILNDGPQNQETLKIDHRWSARTTTTGMYGHQYTKEPGTANQGPFGTIPSDSGASLLEEKGSVGADAAAALYDRVESLEGDVHPTGRFDLRYRKRFEEFLQERLARMRRGAMGRQHWRIASTMSGS